jgi:hypothetical protein
MLDVSELYLTNDSLTLALAHIGAGLFRAPI